MFFALHQFAAGVLIAYGIRTMQTNFFMGAAIAAMAAYLWWDEHRR